MCLHGRHRGNRRVKSSERNIAAVVFIFLYDFFYPIGFLGLTFLYATEVAPLNVRVPITAIANATQWLSQFVVAQITPPGSANLGNRYWIIWAVFNAAGGTIVYFFFPETNGRSLEDVDHVFEQSQGLFDVVGIAKKTPFGSVVDVENPLARLQILLPKDSDKPDRSEVEMIQQK